MRALLSVGLALSRRVEGLEAILLFALRSAESSEKRLWTDGHILKAFSYFWICGFKNYIIPTKLLLSCSGLKECCDNGNWHRWLLRNEVKL